MLFSCSVVSESLWTHGLQHARLPCLLEFAQTHVHWVHDAIQHLVLCVHLPLLPSVLSSIRGFSNELALHIKWPEYWSFSFNISPSNEYLGLTSFWIDCFDLLTVQGILKSPLQYHSSKASIPPRSAIFMGIDQQVEFRGLKCCFLSVPPCFLRPPEQTPQTWLSVRDLSTCQPEYAISWQFGDRSFRKFDWW